MKSMECVINNFKEKILDKTFPCVAAKDALQKGRIEIFTATHLACPNDDAAILNFIYDFTKKFRQSEPGFHSAVILFPMTPPMEEKQFELYLFQRLAALRKMDEANYTYDNRVSENPESAQYSFSLMKEAF